MTDTTRPSGVSRKTSLQTEVMKADPDYAVNSEILPEYEFHNRRSPDGKRLFKGAYKHRGAYSDE